LALDAILIAVHAANDQDPRALSATYWENKDLASIIIERSIDSSSKKS